jgi:hypothetical protein
MTSRKGVTVRTPTVPPVEDRPGDFASRNSATQGGTGNGEHGKKRRGKHDGRHQNDHISQRPQAPIEPIPATQDSGGGAIDQGHNKRPDKEHFGRLGESIDEHTADEGGNRQCGRESRSEHQH